MKIVAASFPPFFIVPFPGIESRNVLIGSEEGAHLYRGSFNNSFSSSSSSSSSSSLKKSRPICTDEFVCCVQRDWCIASWHVTFWFHARNNKNHNRGQNPPSTECLQQ